EALGENAQVLVDLMPELENIIGPRPAAPALSGTAAQNRLNRLFQKFIQVFTTPSHPLVIFLDDLQWADSASLNLMQVLLADAQAGYLLLLGTYRDNEVFPAHPLMLTLDELDQGDTTVHTLILEPLNNQKLNRLVADTLHSPPHVAQPLTVLVMQKTQGNPFFASQFLRVLHQDRLITFDQETGYWQCDIAQVSAAALTDDVVELMAAQLQKLPPDTQEILKLAACMGAQFDLNTLAIVAKHSREDTARFLWIALEQGLVLPISQVYKFFQISESLATETTANPRYRFLHDRVQQAAYELIPHQEKPSFHYLIGQQLLAQIQSAENSPLLFEVTSHLNLGAALLDTAKQREELANLNLLAGNQARQSAAYETAANYFSQGLLLLTDAHWSSHYALMLALTENAAEASHLSGRLADMNGFIATVCDRATHLLDKIKVHEIQIQSNMAQGNLVDAISLGLDILTQLEITLPATPTPGDVETAIGNTLAHLNGRDPRDLVHLPAMTDPHKLAALRILKRVAPCAYQAAPMLLPLLVTEQVNLSMAYGNAPLSASSYGFWGLILCGVVGNIPLGYKFGQLAL
ncbi:MAG: AAA family ATPase, partial [Cyanobacteria bacterium J06642_11]